MIQHNDLHALNLRFLLLAQQASRVDRLVASTFFGLSESLCAHLAECSIDDLDCIAKTNTILFRARFDEDALSLATAVPSPGLRATVIESRSTH